MLSNVLSCCPCRKKRPWMTRRRTKRPRRQRRMLRQRQTRKTTLRTERPRPTRWVWGTVLGNLKVSFYRVGDALHQKFWPLFVLCPAGGGSPRGGQGGGQVRVAPLPMLPPPLQSLPSLNPSASQPAPPSLSHGFPPRRIVNRGIFLSMIL